MRAFRRFEYADRVFPEAVHAFSYRTKGRIFRKSKLAGGEQAERTHSTSVDHEMTERSQFLGLTFVLWWLQAAVRGETDCHGRSLGPQEAGETKPLGRMGPCAKWGHRNREILLSPTKITAWAMEKAADEGRTFRLNALGGLRVRDW